MLKFSKASDGWTEPTILSYSHNYDIITVIIIIMIASNTNAIAGTPVLETYSDQITGA